MQGCWLDSEAREADHSSSENLCHLQLCDFRQAPLCSIYCNVGVLKVIHTSYVLSRCLLLLFVLLYSVGNLKMNWFHFFFGG